MPANTESFHRMMPAAVRQFWTSRSAAATAQQARGRSDQGARASVTAGKNLDGFAVMVRQLLLDNGVTEAEVFTDGRASMTIPGFFRATKNWDLLVIRGGTLVAVVEFKSQVGPSFGNNFNNRVEEALGNATDLLTAFREGAFGESARPLLGYFFVLDECPESTRPVAFRSPHFSALPEFDGASYARRYELLCRKLVQQNLYDAAALTLTSSADAATGAHRSLSELTSPLRFAQAVAGRAAGLAPV